MICAPRMRWGGAVEISGETGVNLEKPRYLRLTREASRAGHSGTTLDRTGQGAASVPAEMSERKRICIWKVSRDEFSTRDRG